MLFVFNNTLYIAGGFSKSLWSSSDGIKWEAIEANDELDSNVPWLNRSWPCILTGGNNRVWMIGGYNKNKGENLWDVWYTKDLITWVKYADDLQPKHASMCVYDASKERILILGGRGGWDPDNGRAFVTNEILALPVNQVED